MHIFKYFYFKILSAINANTAEAIMPKTIVSHSNSYIDLENKGVMPPMTTPANVSLHRS